MIEAEKKKKQEDLERRQIEKEKVWFIIHEYTMK